MFKNKKNITILGLVLLLSAALYLQNDQEAPVIASERLLTSYATTTTRTASVNAFCAGKSRTALTDSSQASAYTLYSNQMQQIFTLDGYIHLHLEIPSLAISSLETQATPPLNCKPACLKLLALLGHSL